MRISILLTASILALSACEKAGVEGDNSGDTNNTVVTTQTPNSEKVVVDSRMLEDPNYRLDQWFEEKFDANTKRYPEFLTALGSRERYDEWNDPSKAFYLESLEITRRNLDEMRSSFNIKQLDDNRALSYRLYEQNALNELDGQKWWGYSYPFNQMFGAQSDIPAFLINRHQVKSVEDAKAYIGRLSKVKDHFTTVIKNSRDSAERGIMPPKFVYGHVIRDAKNIISGAPFDDGDFSTLLADFKGKVDALPDITDEQREELFVEAIDAMETSVGPAYEMLIEELERQDAKATTEDGIWKVPNGEDFYKYRLKMMTTTDMTPDEIHELGVQEVKRIHGEMREIMKEVEFDGTLQEFFVALKNDPEQSYPDSVEGREAYLRDAEVMINDFKARLDEVFLRKPKADMVIKAVEPFREKSAGKAFYNRPAIDGSRPGVYYANLYKIEDMPKYQMEALAFHEGIPGHHMQIAIAQELENVPKFRKFGGYTAYSEGWGLYSEYFPKEMGFYADPYSDFGRLAMELWRAARLVVDTGLHDKKWTREEAIDYLTTNTPNPEGDCIKAIERYIVMPGQATAYKIGMNKILDLRESAREKLGEAFDIREFHEVFLEAGPVPLNILEERVNAWVAKKS